MNELVKVAQKLEENARLDELGKVRQFICNMHFENKNMEARREVRKIYDFILKRIDEVIK